MNLIELKEKIKIALYNQKENVKNGRNSQVVEDFIKQYQFLEELIRNEHLLKGGFYESFESNELKKKRENLTGRYSGYTSIMFMVERGDLEQDKITGYKKERKEKYNSFINFLTNKFVELDMGKQDYDELRQLIDEIEKIEMKIIDDKRGEISEITNNLDGAIAWDEYEKEAKVYYSHENVEARKKAYIAMMNSLINNGISHDKESDHDEEDER